MDLNEMIEECKKANNAVNKKLGLNISFEVDTDESIVYHGEDTFYIESTLLLDYLTLKLQKFNMLRDMRKDKQLDITAWNNLTLACISMHKKDNEEEEHEEN